MAILAAQALLSLLLAVSNTAFADEALYSWVGHLELAEWFHHAHVVLSFTYFLSGAPQIYPPLAALAGSAGGLLGARALSLCFMLGTTVLLWFTAERLSGRRSAVVACALWIACEPCLRMGAFATFDPMAIFCVCLALWAVIRAGSRRHHGEPTLLAAASLALGCVTAYSYAIYIPVVMAVGFLASARGLGLKHAVRLTVWMSACLAVFLVVATGALGLWQGILHTTIHRGIADHETIPSMLQTVWGDAGLIMAVCAAGAVMAIAAAQGWATRLLRLALLAAGFVVPVYQIFVARTGWALDKHLTCGIWCMALVAGTGFASVRWPAMRASARVAATGILLAVAVWSGWFTAYGIQRSWPDMNVLAAVLRPLTATERGNLFTGTTPSYMDFYTWPASMNQVRWESGISLDPPGQHGPMVTYYRAQLRKQAPGLVVLLFPGALKSQSLPARVLAVLRPGKGAQARLAHLASAQEPGLYAFALALQSDPRYRLVSTGPYNRGFGSLGSTPGAFMVWQRTDAVPAARPAPGDLVPHVSTAPRTRLP